MSKFLRWLAGKLLPYTMESLPITYMISKDDNMVFVFKSDTLQSEIDIFVDSVKRIVPENKFLVISTDSPIDVIRIR